MVTKAPYRNPYRQAQHWRAFAKDMRERGIDQIEGQSPDDMDRLAEKLEAIEDKLRGLKNG